MLVRTIVSARLPIDIVNRDLRRLRTGTNRRFRLDEADVANLPHVTIETVIMSGCDSSLASKTFEKMPTPASTPAGIVSRLLDEDCRAR